MGTREIERLQAYRKALYPNRHIAVYRVRDFYVIHNLLTDVRRFYADARDVERLIRLGGGRPPDDAA